MEFTGSTGSGYRGGIYKHSSGCGGRRSRFGGEHQRRVVGDDRTAFQVPFVRVHVMGAPLEPAAGESAQISGQTPFSRHKVQPHFELLLELLLQPNRRTRGTGTVKDVRERQTCRRSPRSPGRPGSARGKSWKRPGVCVDVVQTSFWLRPGRKHDHTLFLLPPNVHRLSFGWYTRKNVKVLILIKNFKKNSFSIRVKLLNKSIKKCIAFFLQLSIFSQATCDFLFVFNSNVIFLVELYVVLTQNNSKIK